ncbi:MAG: hypothetical protein IJ551_10445 [Prevotella sp.]|nr:hypothetical protein [Prevotella sp.]
MKKRFLQLLMSLLCMANLQAADYYYSHTARYKSMGESILANGNFADGTRGWTNQDGENVNAEIWSVESGVAPDGGYSIMSLKGVTEDGNALAQTVSLTPGTYIVSYYIKAETTTSTSVTADKENYLDIFLNADGSLVKDKDAVQVATAETVTDEWTQVLSVAEAETKTSLVFVAQHLAAGMMIANVEVVPVIEVYDIRRLQRIIAYADQLLADENLPEGRDNVLQALEVTRSMLTDETQNEELTSMMELETMFAEEIDMFLEMNGTNLIGTSLTDWSTWGQLNYTKLGTRGTWTFEGGRWGFTGNTDYLEFSEGDGYIASAGIQKEGTRYTLDAGVRTAVGALSNLPAGKYFFSIEAQAVAAANRSNPYGANHNVPIVGPMIFVGSDSLTLENDTLSGYYWKTYYHIAEVKEGEEIKMGFHFPKVSGEGGRYSLRNPQVRQLGVTSEEAAFRQQLSVFTVQQYNLRQRLTNYPAELNAYNWGLDSLQRAVDHARTIYDASLLIVDAEGNVLQRDLVNEEQTQLLLDEVNALGRARNYVIALNEPVDDLKAAVEAANAALADEANASAPAGLRTALQAAVAAGQALLDNISSTPQVEEFIAAAAAIRESQEQFESTTATRSNPTDIQIENADFTAFSAGANYTPATAGELKNGWHWSIGASTSRWEIRDNETLSQGHGASVWRGTTVGLDGKATQRIELTYEGLYEYRAEAYISEERLSELVAAANVIYNADEQPVDTVYTPNIRLFFGEDGRPDSVTVSKCYLGIKNDGSYFTREVSGTVYPGMVYANYSVFFKKTGSAPVTVEFGLEAFDNAANAGANGFGFGNNHIYFVGDEAQYLTDTKADVAKAVAAARSTLASVPANYLTVKLQRYVDDAEKAETAKELQNALFGIQEIASRLAAMTNAVGDVFADEPKASLKADGVFTLQGVKLADSTDHLKPGLYIVNGKKTMVK